MKKYAWDKLIENELKQLTDLFEILHLDCAVSGCEEEFFTRQDLSQPYAKISAM